MTYSFDDFDPGHDAHDDARPDAEAVARILWNLLVTRLPRRFESFDRHRYADQVGIVDAVGQLLDRLRDEAAR